MRKRHEWRCDECGMLLGVLKQDRVHIRYKSLGVDLLVGFPVTCPCRRCHALNEIRSPLPSAEPTTSRTVVFRKPHNKPRGA